MRADLAVIADQFTPRLKAAQSAFGEALAMGGEALAARVDAAQTSWLVATPVEPLGVYPVELIGEYSLTASDGSQILPDRHAGDPAHLVNIGLVDFIYGPEPGFSRQSLPSLYWLPDDTYPMYGGQRIEADGRVVSAKRFAAECDALARRCGSVDAVMMDGTLIMWWLDPDPQRLAGYPPGDIKRDTLDSVCALLKLAVETPTLVSSYLSDPRTTDVVSMLKVVLCTEDPVDCDHCPYKAGVKVWQSELDPGPLAPPAKPCDEADPVTDAALFSRILEPGQRSSRFSSAASVIGAYPCGIDFVYMNTGVEIARLEFPSTMSPEALNRLVGIVADQNRRGGGYPVAVAEAHEAAVVRAEDRRAVLELLRSGLVGHTSAKLARKMQGIV